GEPRTACSINDVIQLIEMTVDPESWRQAGGNIGSIWPLCGDAVVVCQTAPAIHEIELLLGRLSPNSASRFITDDPATRETRQKLKLAIPEFAADSVTFDQAIEQLRAKTGLVFSARWAALSAAGIESDAGVHLHLRDVPAERVLEELLSGIGGGETELGYDIANGVINISTKENLARNRMIAVLDVTDIIRAPAHNAQPVAALESLIELVQRSIEPESWRAAGGNIGTINALSGRLVVIQTPFAQDQVRDLLERLRSGGTAVSRRAGGIANGPS